MFIKLYGTDETLRMHGVGRYQKTNTYAIDGQLQPSPKYISRAYSFILTPSLGYLVNKHLSLIKRHTHLNAGSKSFIRCPLQAILL